MQTHQLQSKRPKFFGAFGESSAPEAFGLVASIDHGSAQNQFSLVGLLDKKWHQLMEHLTASLSRQRQHQCSLSFFISLRKTLPA